MRGEGEEGGSSSYSPGNTPYKIKMGVIVAGVLLGTCKEPKKDWNYFDVTQ